MVLSHRNYGNALLTNQVLCIGQIDVLKSAISCVEKKKQAILHIMAKDVEAKDIAPATPLLSVVNPEYYNSKTFVEGDPFLSLNSVVITPKGLLQKDQVFKEAIESIFEDLEEEQDVIFMLSLINEKSKKENSRWHYFIERTRQVTKKLIAYHIGHL